MKSFTKTDVTCTRTRTSIFRDYLKREIEMSDHQLCTMPICGLRKPHVVPIKEAGGQNSQVVYNYKLSNNCMILSQFFLISVFPKE